MVDPRPRADVLAFVLQREGPDALGDYGGGLGYGYHSDHHKRIVLSLAIEFDGWSNSRDGYDPESQHVGVTVDGEMRQHLVDADPGFSLRRQGPVYAWVGCDASTHSLGVWVSQSATPPAEPLLVTQIDLAAQIGSEPVFTGSTGRIQGTVPLTSVLTWSLLVQ